MKVAIHTPTEAEYNELMEYLQEKDYEWKTGFLPTQVNNHDEYKDQTVICLSDMDITYCRYTYAVVECYQIIPFSELKANNYKIEVQL